MEIKQFVKNSTLIIVILFLVLMSGCTQSPTECTNECSAGETKCIGYETFICANYDNDNCLEWSTGSIVRGECGVECKSNADCDGETCVDYKCVSGCTDECNLGETKCEFPNYFECGNYDEDSCLEWSEGSVTVGECGVECKNGGCPSGYKCVDFKCELITSNTFHGFCTDQELINYINQGNIDSILVELKEFCINGLGEDANGCPVEEQHSNFDCWDDGGIRYCIAECNTICEYYANGLPKTGSRLFSIFWDSENGVNEIVSSPGMLTWCG